MLTSWRKPFVGARKVLVEWQNPLVAKISEAEGKNMHNLSIEGFQLSPQQSVCGCYSKTAIVNLI